MDVKPTMVRLSEETRARIKALAGTYGMATFIRDAIEAKLNPQDQDAVRQEGYIIALANMRDYIRRRVNEPDVSNDGKLELLDLLSMLDDMLKGGNRDDPVPEPMSGSF